MVSKLSFAKNYSEALFQLMNDKHQLDSGYQELNNVNQVFQDTPKLIPMLNSTFIPDTEKGKLVAPLLSNVKSKYIANLLKVAFANDLAGAIPSVVKDFNKEYDAQKGIVHVTVVSAVKLDSTQLKDLQNVLINRLNAKQVVLNNQLDPSIIGGLQIKYHNKIIDGSVKSKIDEVKQLLLDN